MRIAGLLLSFCLVGFIGCKKGESPNSNPPPAQPPTAGVNEITYYNGACGYNNNTFLVNPNSARFGVNQNYTAVQQLKNNVGALSLNFPGAAVGNFLLSNSTGSVLFVQLNDSVSTCAQAAMVMSDSVVVSITKYQSVGGLIEGTWSGRLKLMTDPLQKINATGKFSLIRGADQ